MKNAAKIVVDPTSRILYSSFYIQGLYEVFGRQNVSFGQKYFSGLPRTAEPFSFNHYFAFVRIDRHKITRYVIDFCDPPDISQPAYDWCDVYAKINFEPSAAPDLKKLRVIPPSFGIRIWSFPTTVWHALKNLLAGYPSLPVPVFKFMQDYWQQYRRLPLGRFFGNPDAERCGYIFLAATLWTGNENANKTNKYRKKFIETCRSMAGLDFEGGLYADPNHPDFHNFEQVAIAAPYSFADFLKKSKESTMVFSTPAVHNCHGWKLAEFLAMGKAIISTPLSYNLATPLVHRRHIHFISGEDEIETAIRELNADESYRKDLAKNARQYFLEFMTPGAVIESLTSRG